VYLHRRAFPVGGGRASIEERKPGEEMHYLKAWELLWKMVLVLLRYGNAEIRYHICPGADPAGGSCWGTPMNAENVEVREGASGPVVTIF
jgi:hypothetical protein